MTEVQRLFLLLALAAGYFLLRLLGPILTPFVLAAILAYMCDPVVDRLERWHFRRPLAVAVLMFAAFLLLVALPALLVPLIYQGVTQFAARLPEYVQWANDTAWPWLQQRLQPLAGDSDWTTMLRDKLSQNIGGVTGFLQALLAKVMQSGRTVATFVINLLMTFVVFGYLLQDWDRIRERLLALVPRRHEPTVRAVGGEVNAVLGGFLRGQLLIMLYIAVALSTGLLLLGLDLAIPIGLFAGAVCFIPWVGSTLGVLFAVIAAVVQFRDLAHPAIALGIYFVVNQIGDTLVTPRVMGDRIGVHPVGIVFAVLAGGRLFGVFGLVLAVPAAAVIKVVGGHFLRRYRESRLYQGGPAPRPRIRRRYRGGPHA